MDDSETLGRGHAHVGPLTGCDRYDHFHIFWGDRRRSPVPAQRYSPMIKTLFSGEYPTVHGWPNLNIPPHRKANQGQNEIFEGLLESCVDGYCTRDYVGGRGLVYSQRIIS